MEINEVEQIEQILSDVSMSDEMKAACIYGISFTNTVTELEAKLRGGHDFDLISNDALKTTLEFYDADNVIMANTDVDLQIAGNYTHEITREGVTPVCGNDPIYLAKYPMFLQAIERDEAIAISDIGTLFPQDSVEYKRLVQANMKSFIAVPYHKRHSGLVAVVNPRRFTDKIGLLQVLSYVSVAEINEKALMQLLKENQESESPVESMDVYVKLFDRLEIRNHNGILTEANFKTPRHVALVACSIMSGKAGYSGEMMETGFWFNSTKPTNRKKALQNMCSESRDVMRQFFPDGDLVCAENYRFGVSPKYRVRTDLDEMNSCIIDALRETDASKKIELYKKILADYSGSILPIAHDFTFIHDLNVQYEHKRLNVLRKCLELLASEHRYEEMLDLTTPEMFRYCTDPYLFYWIIKAYIGTGESFNAQSIFENHENYLMEEQVEEIKALLNL